MTEPQNNIQQPAHPGTAQKYDLLREAALETAVAAIRSTHQQLFTMHITATSEKGAPMDNGQQFLIDLVFKPNESGVKLLPQQSQLLLAYFGEILKEIEIEEQHIIEEEKISEGSN